MIEETAVIIACEGGHARVKTERSSACNSCSVKSACDTAALKEEAADGREAVLRALNPIGAQPGERVVIGFEETAVTKASLAIYVAPLAGFILFALLGQGIGQWLGISPEPAAVLGGVLGLSLGFLWLRRFAAKAGYDEKYQAVVLRRAGESKITIDCNSAA
ncbi:MAG TPA: Fis family transcriptional regulator [Sedimenticola sp.]|nr:Fis family transcriptional regulator [Sedimenticola sp.]